MAEVGRYGWMDCLAVEEVSIYRVGLHQSTSSYGWIAREVPDDPAFAPLAICPSTLDKPPGRFFPSKKLDMCFIH